MKRTRLESAGIALGVTIVVGAIVVALLLRPDEEPDSDASAPRTFDYRASAPLQAVNQASPSTADAAYAVREIAYTSFDGKRVHARLQLPRGEAGPYQCVVYQGGLGYTLRAFVVSPALRETGWAVFSIQPRLSGDAGSDAFIAAKHARSLANMLRGTVIDLRRSLDYLEMSAHCLPGIGFMGESLGGMIGALLAGSDERIEAAALISAGGDWRELLQGLPEFFVPDADGGPPLERALEVLAPVDPADWIGEVDPRPVLMLNGAFDTIVPPEAAAALHNAAGPASDVISYGGGHNPFSAERATDLYLKIRRFLERALE